VAPRSVRVVEHRTSWAAEFQRLAEAIRTELGDLALRIDHVGSTAVPGLAAKDVIDVQVTVAKLADSRVADGIEAAGFSIRADIFRDHVPPWAEPVDRDWEKRFAEAGPDDRRSHIHVREAGRPNQRYALLFRDYLREHDGAAMAYERVKRTLAAVFPDESGAYADAKDPVCDLIVMAAEQWALTTAWAPGDTDA
jgi:GrpB-like predicted nucleotidyltransferase (UPF0157 family)